MQSSLDPAAGATPRERLAEVRPSPAKAELKAQVSATRLRDVAAEALRRATSQKAAATDIGVHEGRLSHKLKDGSLTLAQLETLGPDFGKELGDACREQFGETDPKAYARRLHREIRERLAELEQFIEMTS